MKHRLLALALCGGLIAAGSTAALAQDQHAPAPGTAPASIATIHYDHMHRGWHHGDRHGHGMRGHGFRVHGPAMAVIGTLGRLERLYRMQGKTADVRALYRDVLNKTKDPQVRHFAYGRLARAELKPADTAAAVATLRKSLDESLAQLNQRDRKRAEWKAKHQAGKH